MEGKCGVKERPDIFIGGRASVHTACGTLPEEASALLQSCGRAPFRAMRYNPLKICASGQSAAQERPNPEAIWTLRQVPWCAEGYYYGEADQPGKHALHAAGAYYIQEPSAMLPAELLRELLTGQRNTKESREDGAEKDAMERSLAGRFRPLRVLDLCAAPGGKSTQLAGMLCGRGVLVANEIHPARAKILSENLERMGVRNAVVMNETPERLAERFPGFFDAILVDAPCSGEGMFRKEPEAIAQWRPENVALCAERQAGILDHAAGMLRPGGSIVYSTCTFEPAENEENIAAFLARHPEFSAQSPDTVLTSVPNGKKAKGLDPCPNAIRLLPTAVEGEGQFAVLLRKAGDALPADPLGGFEAGMLPSGKKGKKSREKKENAGIAGRGGNHGKGESGGKIENLLIDYTAFLEESIAEDCFLRREIEQLARGEDIPGFSLFGDNLYRIPDGTPSLHGLRILRCGLHLGALRKNRFEPSHALALALSSQEVRNVIHLNDADAALFLSGQTFPAEGAVGWTLVCTRGYSLGWGKLTGGMLKNHYPKGLRRG